MDVNNLNLVLFPNASNQLNFHFYVKKHNRYCFITGNWYC